MTERQKIAHLLRRFGFGVAKNELDRYEKQGLQKTIDELLDFEKVEEGFPVSPWEFCFEPNLPDVYLEPPRIASWWALRMLVGKRPLQEKLTLFWHDHFAVSASKVEFGPMMLSYNETLRRNCAGNFSDLLSAVSREPAMIRWLDTDGNTSRNPNENFAREVLELFTMGIGNYTELDIKETARAFTGWGNRYLIFEAGGERVQEKAKECIARDEPMVAFCLSPALHDSGPKKILGQTANFDGEQVLAMLAKRPETATYVTRKIWEFFVYANPEPAVMDRLAGVFTSTHGNIRSVMRTLTEMPEFWSQKAFRAQVKSPADFTVAILRQFELSQIVLSLRGPAPKPQTPLAKPVRDSAGLVLGAMFQQGMLLLYPPDVGGWQWGTAWISATNMLERVKLADLVFGVGQQDKPLAGYLAKRIVDEFAPRNGADIAGALVSLFDADLPPEKLRLLAESCEKEGGVASLSKPDTASVLLAKSCRLLFAAPEFQFF